MNYEKMTKAELINKLKSLDSDTENSKRRKEEIRLERSEEKYHKLIEIANDAILLVDVETEIILNANKRAEDLLGVPVEEIVGMNRSQMYPPEDRERNNKIFHKNVGIGRIVTSEDILILHNDGRKIPVEISSNILELDGKKALLAIFRDITKQKQSEMLLKESEARYRDIVVNMSDWIWEVDAQSRYTYTSGSVREILGYDNEELMGRTPFDLMPPEEAERVATIFSQISTNRSPIVDLENWNRTKDGREVCLLTNGVPILDNEGELLGYRGVDKDITVRKEAEQVLNKYQLLFDNIYDLAYICDAKGNCIFLNKVFGKFSGHKPEEFIGKSFAPLFDKDNLKKALDIYTRTLNGESPREEICYKDTGVLCEFQNRPLRDKKGDIVGVIGIGRDISERKQAEEKIKYLNETLEQRVFERTEELLKVNNEIRESEAWFRSILSSLYEAAIIVYDHDGKITSLWGTHEMDTRYGIRAVDAVGKSIRELTSPEHPEHAEQLINQIRHIMDTGTKVIYEHMISVPNGNFWHETSLSPLRDAEGKITAAVGFVRDITERKMAEEELDGIFNLSLDMIASGNLDGYFTKINPSFKRILGYKEEELLQKPFLEFVYSEDIEKTEETLAEAVKGKRNIIVDNRCKCKDGSIKWIEWKIRTVEQERKFIAVGRDITERKQAEKSLREASKLNEKIISESPIGLAIYNQTGQCIEANKSIAKMINATQEQVLEQNYKKIESWKKSGLLDAADKAIRLQKNERHEFDVLSSFDKHVFLDCTFVPFMSNQEQHLLLILDDITSRKLTDQKLAKQNSYLKLLQVTAVAANESTDIKDAFLPILAEICHYTGWEIGHAYVASENNPDLLKPTEVWCLDEQKPFTDFCNITKKTDFLRGVGLPGRVLASSKPHWIVDVRTDKGFLRAKIAKDLNINSGIAFPVMVGPSVVAVLEFFTTREVKPDQQFMGIMTDVGTQIGRVVERMQAREALIQSERRFRKYFELGLVGMAITSREKYWVEFNDMLCKMFGYSRKDFSRLTWAELTHPEDLESDLVQYNRVLAGDIDGYSMEKRFIHRSGSIIYTVISTNVLRKADGSVDHFVALVHDITKRKQMEDALIQSEKMKAMGIMASGVAHEFNNILAVISSNAQLLEETNKSDNELVKSLHTICRMTDDGAEIVNRMYEFTNVSKNTSEYISVDLNDLIKQVIGFTMPRWKEMAQADGIKYQIVQKGVRKLPSVLGNPSELREVILNIVNNALDAMPGGGTIKIKTRIFQCSATGSFPNGVDRKDELESQVGVGSKKKKKLTNSVTHGFKREMDCIGISFEDTGTGISEEVKKRMFDPFFTTKSPHGTGLGMSVSYGIIARHGGKINVENELEKGCVISLSLPVTDRPIRRVVASIDDGNLDIEKSNILVVDDKKEICESLSKLFIEQGHKVCSVNNGKKAINLLKINNYDLLLCDLVMPDMSGKDVIKSLASLSKRPKVGLITGWRYKIENAEKDGLEVDFIVKKPFNLSKLRRDINNLWG